MLIMLLGTNYAQNYVGIIVKALLVALSVITRGI